MPSAEAEEVAALKAPFPAFGGKARIAAIVWPRLGVGDDSPRNFIEPFMFSGAMTLKRPGGAGAVETVNDLNAYVSNFWRAVQKAPELVALHADWPVNETDLHARHRWLVGSMEANRELQRVREDPEYFNAKIAGWWCWGACCWIGSGWCDETNQQSANGKAANEGNPTPGSSEWKQAPLLSGTQGMIGGGGMPSEQLILLGGDAGAHGRGVTSSAMSFKAVGQSGNMTSAESMRVELHRSNRGEGRGITGPGEKRVKLTGNAPCGVHSKSGDDGPSPVPQAEGHQQKSVLGMACGPLEAKAEDPLTSFGARSEREEGDDVGPRDGGRVQLADQFARGRGVNGKDALGTCDARRAWITAWMRALADRLRPVRVCCGHWDRACDSPSTMTRLGTTAVFLDPPYAKNIARVQEWIKRLRAGEAKAKRSGAGARAGAGPEQAHPEPAPALDPDLSAPAAARSTNRTSHIYANDKVQDVDRLVAEVTLWCLKWGPDPEVRIALCGLEGEYPEIVAAGWEEVAWKSNGGYGNQSGKKNENRERVWFSPHCVKVEEPDGPGLFG